MVDSDHFYFENCKCIYPNAEPTFIHPYESRAMNISLMEKEEKIVV